MKIYKKVVLGLSFVAVLSFLFMFIFSGNALAKAISSQEQIKEGLTTLRFINRATIQGEFAEQAINFIDVNPFDKNYNYKPVAGFFCSTGDTIKGITIQNNGISPGKFGNVSDSVLAHVDLDYNTNGTTGDQGCQNTKDPNNNNEGYFRTGVRTEKKAFIYMDWRGNTLVDLASTKNNRTLSQLGATNLYVDNEDDTCFGGYVVLLENDNLGTRYRLTEHNVADSHDAQGDSKLGQYFTQDKECWIIEDDTLRMAIFGVRGSQQTGSGGGIVDADASCESNFSSGFEWIICPAMKLADKAAAGVNSFIENQLCFRTNEPREPTTTSGVICKGNNNLTDQVHAAWSVLKNIASALLVIVMLVMVFSQAIGGGLFDAYTLRKMLPRVVAAVILIQLSWVLFKFAIDLSNDFGKGIQSLMYFPFGGESQMHLDKLLANVAKNLSITSNNTWAFFTVLAGGTAAIANLPGLLTVALFVILALFTAFFVLVLRKILIVLLILLAPIAFIAWILPGTENYWKMWRQNFIKLLAMFPLIMALIAAGRIFAYVASGGPEPASSGLTPHLASAHLEPLASSYVASVTTFADLAIVIFAYFGPYLLLPKAFSWGGQLMGAAASAVQNYVNKPAMEKGREGIKGLSERYHGRAGKAYDPNALMGKRILTRIASGHFIPTKRSQRLTILEGDKWQKEKDEQALAKINRMGETVMRQGYATFERNADGEMLDAAGNVTTDKSKAEKKQLAGVAAMKQMWVDLAEDGDSDEQKMAIRQLTATSSWPEIQDSFTKNGKRVIDTDGWSTSITTSPEDYPRVLRSRVDATPHIDVAAKGALQNAIKSGRVSATDAIEQRRFVSAFRINYSIEKQMGNEDFQTQSDGYWGEVGRMVTTARTPEEIDLANQIRANLVNRFTAIRDIGGTAPYQLLGHLKNGGELQRSVESALGHNIDTYLPP